MKTAEEVRGECPDVEENFQVALSEMQDIGENFHASVNAFLDNPEDEEFHSEMLRASRSLLSSVTRILILADLIDVSQLHRCLENIKGDAECVGILTDESVWNFVHCFLPIVHALAFHKYRWLLASHYSQTRCFLKLL